MSSALLPMISSTSKSRFESLFSEKSEFMIYKLLLTSSESLFSINFWEFVAATITIVFVVITVGVNVKILELTDNTSALGWLHKASFDPAGKSSYDWVARWLAKFLIEHNYSI